MNAYQIPGDHLELTADVVRLARAARHETRGADILAEMQARHPERSERDIRISMGYAAELLLEQHQ